MSSTPAPRGPPASTPRPRLGAGRDRGGRGRRTRRRAPAAPDPAAQADRDRAQLPRPRGRVRARHPRGAGAFAKFTSAWSARATAIVIPREETRPDYEGEVAVVIGRRTYRADAAAARAAVGGISAMNDVSGRRAQLETPLRQFTLGKSFDTFAPMGPCVASADGVDLERSASARPSRAR